mmetsp:Transcript_15612/g.27897  ORF Transcript_15612/g.27897 Transcript_15612/m.27897 type:complete len:406 (+) Transcript_15612:624-1841(+)
MRMLRSEKNGSQQRARLTTRTKCIRRSIFKTGMAAINAMMTWWTTRTLLKASGLGASRHRFLTSIWLLRRKEEWLREIGNKDNLQTKLVRVAQSIRERVPATESIVKFGRGAARPTTASRANRILDLKMTLMTRPTTASRADRILDLQVTPMMRTYLPMTTTRIVARARDRCPIELLTSTDQVMMQKVQKAQIMVRSWEIQSVVVTIPTLTKIKRAPHRTATIPSTLRTTAKATMVVPEIWTTLTLSTTLVVLARILRERVVITGFSIMSTPQSVSPWMRPGSARKVFHHQQDTSGIRMSTTTKSLANTTLPTKILAMQCEPRRVQVRMMKNQALEILIKAPTVQMKTWVVPIRTLAGIAPVNSPALLMRVEIMSVARRTLAVIRAMTPAAARVMLMAKALGTPL